MNLQWSYIFPTLHILFSSVHLCEIPGGNVQKVNTLNLELLEFAEDASRELNPSVYLALRLSDRHDPEKEERYLQRLRDAFQPGNGSSTGLHYRKHPGTGRLALYLLSLRAACHDMKEEGHLITQLKQHLYKEIQHIGHKAEGHPVTNFYQFGLGVLALCVHQKKVGEREIGKLLHAEAHGRFQHHGRISVDTEAMAGMAFACLLQAPFYTPELAAKLNRSLESVKDKILGAQTADGVFGNVYSSPLAVQFLIAKVRQKQPECARATAALFRGLEQGDFRNALTKSQLLPALYGKSYLDVARQTCPAGRGRAEETLVLRAAPTPAPRKTEPQRRDTGVQLVVKSPPRRLPLYKQVHYVPRGSSLLDVLKAARRQKEPPFTFETQSTLSGPMLTSVMGVKAREGERKYWKVLRAPNAALEEGEFRKRLEVFVRFGTARVLEALLQSLVFCSRVFLF